MAESTAQDSNGGDSTMGAVVVKSILLGLPVGLLLMIGVFWLLTDLDLPDAVGAGLLPGILFGAFAGGFAGVAMAMAKDH